MPGAVVVDVLALLDLCRECASASAAGHEPCKRMPPLRVAGMVGGCEHGLHAVVEVLRDSGLVQSLVKLSQPVELAVVDRILQYLMDPRSCERAAAGSVRQAGSRRLLGKNLQRVLP